MNRKQLQKKLGEVTSALLKEKGYISFVDVFIKLGYLDPKDYENWRMKRIPYLEKVIKVNLGKINFIMKTVRSNSINGNLSPSWTGYKSWGKGKKVWLRFSKTGEENIEKNYATHFIKSKKSKNKIGRLGYCVDTQFYPE
ncbi:MAG: hypothetical protein PVG39_19170 [Desulfobacteraceae bacterium]|jgi:hypothetical protein